MNNAVRSICRSLLTEDLYSPLTDWRRSLYFDVGYTFSPLDEMKSRYWILLHILLFLPGILGGIDFEKARYNMVESQIGARGIEDAATLRAMRTVERHKFVPSRLEKLAYEDRPLPIGYDQTISQPYIVAYMTEQLRPQPHYRALEIGTGSGYQAAVLAEIVSEVYSVEIVSELAEQAEARLKVLGYDNVHVKDGDGFFGWKEAAPFDIIIVTANAESVPPHLFDQLSEGGRMIIPIGPQWGLQNLVMVRKVGDKMKKQKLVPVRFVPFTRKEGSE